VEVNKLAFLNKKEKQEDMIVSTVEDIGRPYDAIGLVTKSIVVRALDTPCDPKEIAAKLSEEARKMGADAIVGFRYETRSAAASIVNEIAYGTAVKFK
jgi:molybdopterin-guanine dinucleotide biosynthesis protein A